MEPDKYQQAWQKHSTQTRVTVDADLLLKQVQRNQQYLLAAISWGNTGVIGTLLLLLPVWIYMGVKMESPWTWYLMVPADIWIIGFIVVYRMRHKRKPSEPGEPLLKCVKESLALVEQEIWYYRNLLWWYILPMAIPMLASTVHVSLLKSSDWLGALFDVNSFVIALFLAIFYFTYSLNRRVVRTQYEPRRQELRALLASLSDESTGEHAAMHIAVGTTKTCTPPRWAMVVYFGVIICVCIVCIIISNLQGDIFSNLRSDIFSNLRGDIFSNLQGVTTDSSYDGPPRSSGPAGDSLARLITDQRKEKNLVGLAAMVMVNGQVEAAAAHGQRKIGSGVSLEIGDRWHLGGITKSMTATMIARLVESGQMQWTDTIGEIFPEASVHEDWKTVTLRQLLTDTAGAPANFPREVSRKRPPLGSQCAQARREAVLDVIADKPAYPPGKKYAYSNVGYTIAGAMAEKVTGATWEDLVKREVFEPLELTEAGFGPPKSADETLEQPRGHRKVLAGKVSVDDKSDNTPIMGPAATIHMTLQNLCTFAREHMLGQLGTGKILSAETYKRLHAPELDAYACGWLRKEPSADIPCIVYWHNGSNTYWYALVVFIPEKNLVVAVTSNDGDSEQAEAAAWEIVKASVKQFTVGVDPARREP